MLTWIFTKTPLLLFAQSFWRDEAFSYFMAKKSVLEIIVSTARDFSPPLYYLVLHYWMKVFGGSEIALRSLSLVFFWATTYVAFLFLNDIFKYKLKKSFFYLIFFVINPLLLYYAFEARMYTMFAFFASLSYYAFFKKNYQLYLLSAIAGLFTQYYMILVILSQLFYLIINKKRVESFKKSTIYISLFVFLPWFVYFLAQNGFPNSFWISKPQFKDIFGLLGVIYTGNEYSFYGSTFIQAIFQNLFYSSIILSLITAVGIFLYRKKLSSKEKLNYQLLFIWGIGIAAFVGLISFIKPLYFPRYLIFTTVGFLLLTVFVLEKINVYFRIVFIIVLMTLTFNYQRLQIEYRKKTDLRKTLREIQIIADKNDLIYTDDLDFFTAQYYFDENRVYIYGKSYKEIPTYNGKTLISKEKVALTLPFYPQKAFILKSNGDYTISAMY